MRWFWQLFCGVLLAAPLTAQQPFKLTSGKDTVTFTLTNTIDGIVFNQRVDTVLVPMPVMVYDTVFKTDTLWRAVPLPVSRGVAFPNGTWRLPEDSLCTTYGYSLTTINITKTILAELEIAKRCKGRVQANLPRRAMKDSLGLNVRRATQFILSNDSTPDLTPYIKDSTLVGFLIGDDIAKSTEWNPKGKYSMTTQLAMWDSIAAAVTARFPGLPPTIRARPVQLSQRPTWVWLKTAIAQYKGYNFHKISPQQFVAQEVAAAKQLKLGLMLGLNYLNGGCGPKTGRITGADPYICPSEYVGTTRLGEQAGDYQMSGWEVEYYSKAFLAEPYMCGLLSWVWSPTEGVQFHEWPDVQAAIRAVEPVAESHPASSCSR